MPGILRITGSRFLISGCCLLTLAWYALVVVGLIWSITDYTSGARQHVPIDIAVWVVAGVSILNSNRRGPFGRCQRPGDRSTHDNAIATCGH